MKPDLPRLLRPHGIHAGYWRPNCREGEAFTHGLPVFLSYELAQRPLLSSPPEGDCYRSPWSEIPLDFVALVVGEIGWRISPLRLSHYLRLSAEERPAAIEAETALHLLADREPHEPADWDWTRIATYLVGLGARFVPLVSIFDGFTEEQASHVAEMVLDMADREAAEAALALFEHGRLPRHRAREDGGYFP